MTITLQEIYEGLINDLGADDFDPGGWGMRERIWEALQAANRIPSESEAEPEDEA